MPNNTNVNFTGPLLPLDSSKQADAGIYIHIPFCKQACIYCNFHFSTSLKYKKELVDALIREIELQRDYVNGAKISTVYFGGGTPSLLSADEINLIFDAVLKNHPVDKLLEFTLEANPDDLSKNYLRSLQNTPVDRLSIGVQSFREKDLLYMKRAHTARDADYAVKAAQDAGYANLSIDLIYGTPGLTDEAWKDNLSQISKLSIPHFSAYALTVEEKTALYHSIAKNKSTPVDPEQAAGQFEILSYHAELMGYDHYEISNLGLPGHHAIHNTNYWMGKSYLGIGPAAHSFNGTTRRWNIANNAVYTKNLLTLHKPTFEEEKLTPIEHLNEYIMTSLRTMWGCNLNIIDSKWSSVFTNLVVQKSHRFLEKQWLILEGRNLILTKAGKLFADKIASDLFFSDQENPGLV